jgi:hypothetical protein
MVKVKIKKEMIAKKKDATSVFALIFFHLHFCTCSKAKFRKKKSSFTCSGLQASGLACRLLLWQKIDLRDNIRETRQSVCRQKASELIKQRQTRNKCTKKKRTKTENKDLIYQYTKNILPFDIWQKGDFNCWETKQPIRLEKP